MEVIITLLLTLALIVGTGVLIWKTRQLDKETGELLKIIEERGLRKK